MFNVPVLVAKEVAAHDGEEKHEEEQEEDYVDHPLADGVNQSRHQHLITCG